MLGSEKTGTPTLFQVMEKEVNPDSKIDNKTVTILEGIALVR